MNPAKNYFVKALTELIVGKSAILPRVGMAEKWMKFFRGGHTRSTDSFPKAAFPDHGFVGSEKATPCKVLPYLVKVLSKALCQYQAHVRQGKEVLTQRA